MATREPVEIVHVVGLGQHRVGDHREQGAGGEALGEGAGASVGGIEQGVAERGADR